MQHAMRLSCVGQTFAGPRCGDSREKKARSRKSKDERKAMAESFIKKFQDLNNGNFPSLNLTHKEVGGSFYTVREIVREIIQENKVLRPGSPTSKVLNLVDCSENQEVESFSMDPASHLSISTIGHLIDARQLEIDSQSEDHKILSEGCDIPKSDAQEVTASQPKENSQLMQGKHYHLEKSFCNETVSNGYIVGGQNEVDPSKVYGKTNDNSAMHKEVHAEVLGHSFVEHGTGEVEQPVPLNQTVQPVPIISNSCESGMNDNDTQNRSNNLVAEIGNSSEKSSVDATVTTADLLPEKTTLNPSSTGIFSDQLQDRPDSYASEVFPLASMIAKTYDTEEKFLQTEGSTSSEEVLRAHNSSKKDHVDFPVVEEFPIRKRTETDKGSSFPINEEAVTITAQLTSEISRNEPRAAPCPDNLLRTISDIKSHGESISPNVSMTPEPKVEAEQEGLHKIGMSGMDNNSTRRVQQKLNNKPVAEENNPLWTAVKGFLTAFIRFWTG